MELIIRKPISSATCQYQRICGQYSKIPNYIYGFSIERVNVWRFLKMAWHAADNILNASLNEKFNSYLIQNLPSFNAKGPIDSKSQ